MTLQQTQPIDEVELLATEPALKFYRRAIALPELNAEDGPHQWPGLPKRIGLNLERLRAEREITKEDFATDSGFDRGYLSGVERRVRNPSALVLQRIAEALHVDIGDLFQLRAASEFARTRQK